MAKEPIGDLPGLWNRKTRVIPAPVADPYEEEIEVIDSASLKTREEDKPPYAQKIKVRPKLSNPYKTARKITPPVKVIEERPLPTYTKIRDVPLSQDLQTHLGIVEDKASEKAVGRYNSLAETLTERLSGRTNTSIFCHDRYLYLATERPQVKRKKRFLRRLEDDFLAPLDKLDQTIEAFEIGYFFGNTLSKGNVSGVDSLFVKQYEREDPKSQLRDDSKNIQYLMKHSSKRLQNDDGLRPTTMLLSVPVGNELKDFKDVNYRGAFKEEFSFYFIQSVKLITAASPVIGAGVAYLAGVGV